MRAAVLHAPRDLRIDQSAAPGQHRIQLLEYVTEIRFSVPRRDRIVQCARLFVESERTSHQHCHARPNGFELTHEVGVTQPNHLVDSGRRLRRS